MPKEKFYPETAVEDDGSEPSLTIAWGADSPAVWINGVEFDRSGLNRLIRAARKARDQTYGQDS
jgi:hypothetical protein